ncbi:unnamed protein product [Linum tenue]|uniref:Uncharacterized protein n=1 Tax=Linum tenue TaxID=586396 RepID=A0AAV0QYT8_9ROSI|nr:unnamed protein product [Linum tenue]
MAMAMAMAASTTNVVRNPKTLFLIWSLCIIFFFSLLQMAIKNSATSSTSSDSHIAYNEQRSRLYDKMARDLDEKGAAFLKHGETSQSLSLSDIFTLKEDGSVTPVLKAADPPVRANVLYLSPEYSLPISDAVKHVFAPYFNKAIWFQNSTVYHFSMVHASHHITPVPATESQIEAEAAAVKTAVRSFCPLKIVLDRVVLTSTGVLLGCWQVSDGTDPVTIRAKLRSVLPHAPEQQLSCMLHCSMTLLFFIRHLQDSLATLLFQTSLQRFFDKTPFFQNIEKIPDDAMQLFHELVAKLNNKLHGSQAVVSELWYVEEYDVLALALDGRMKVRRFQLGCKSTGK